MPFFYVLIEGVTWKIASKLVTNKHNYSSTLNRRFNKWINVGIFKNTYDDILDEYLKNNDINEVHIDSTDIMNKNLSKKYTYKSFKLSKQAIRLSIIGDNNKAPLDYAINKAEQPDNVLGYDFIMNTNLHFNHKTKIYGDKGYKMNKYKIKNMIESKKLQLVVPKKRYKKKKKYKTKNYKPKRIRIRHSQQMKDGLKRRVRIEHINSDLHRSYKRIDKVNEKKIETFDAFIKLAISMILINKT